MPRGGRRPGAGRPREGVESRTVRITLPMGDWGVVDRTLAEIAEAYEASQARTLGKLLLLGVEAYRTMQRPWRDQPLNLEHPSDQEAV